jgi:hypothetical protein
LLEQLKIERAAPRPVAQASDPTNAHSARRYLHMEAVFVFGGALDHLSARAGNAKRRTAFTIEDEKGIQS